jgi:hypothetical protein
MATAPSPRATDMIIGFEVGGPRSYKSGATWPGGQSGITIGIGYDLGYHTKDQVTNDWGSKVSPLTLSTLLLCCGRVGAFAKAYLPSVYVNIPYAVAINVYENTDIPEYSKLVLSTFSNCDMLSEDSFGALVSLVFNRGASMTDSPPGSNNRLEMRQIRDAMATCHFDVIPTYFRNMERLWVNGLVERREKEAQLFQDGLAPTPTLTLVSPDSPEDADDADALNNAELKDIGTAQ